MKKPDKVCCFHCLQKTVKQAEVNLSEAMEANRLHFALHMSIAVSEIIPDSLLFTSKLVSHLVKDALSTSQFFQPLMEGRHYRFV